MLSRNLFTLTLENVGFYSWVFTVSSSKLHVAIPTELNFNSDKTGH